MDLGCWALLSNERSLKDQPVLRSHPNKAVDVAFNQASEKQHIVSSDQQQICVLWPSFKCSSELDT